MSVEIKKITAKRKTKTRLKVAAYARVSTLKEEQAESWSSQVEYYTQFIQKNPDWDFAGVYADNGISGTESKNRPELQRMIEDCHKGLIDTVYVKSISRLGRNLSEVLEIVNDLREYGTGIIMEREGIDTLDPQSEIVFNIMAAIAQEESRSISGNTKWSYINLARQGIRHLGNNRVYGYDEIDGKLTPNKDAWIPKYAFEHYAAGETCSEIAEALSNLGVVGMKTNKPINASAIRTMIKNEIYMGDRILQKQPPIHYLTKKPDYTVDYESYYIKDDHEPIISREIWEKAQERLEKNRELCASGIYKKRQNHFMYGRIYCGECGNLMVRKAFTYHGEKQKMWKCRERVKGSKGNGCKNDVISEEELFKIILEHVGLNFIDTADVTPEDFSAVVKVTISKGRVVTVENVTETQKNLIMQ